MNSTDLKSPIIFLEEVNLSYIDNLRSLNFEKIVKSSYAPQRLETWYGYGSNLQSIKNGRAEVEWKKDFPEWLDELRKKYFPDSNSALICKGQKPESDTSIEWHRDHGTFESRVVMINFGNTIFYLQDYLQGTIVHTLKDCEVVDFDSKLLHKSTQLSKERYIITFRRTKREFSSQKLF